MRPLLTLLLCLIAYTSFCQSSNYEMSAPIDLPTQGWNKALMMSNGNTLLFHLEPRKGIIVKVFDKSHKEIASKKHICKVLDINALEHAVLHGIYEINGDAVLFLEQPLNNRNSLVRLRISAEDGHLVSESLVMRSAAFGDASTFIVLKNKSEEGYKIFYSSDVKNFNDNNLMLVSYTREDTATDTAFIDVNRKDFKYISVYNADIDNTGAVNITMMLTNVAVSASHFANIYDQHPTKFDIYLGICYLPKGAKRFVTTLVHAPENFQPNYEETSYNPFANNLNFLFETTTADIKRFGLKNIGKIQRKPLILIVNGNDMSAKCKWLENDSLNAPFRKIDTGSRFVGIPLKMFTDENGLTTIIYEQYDMFYAQQNGYNVPYTSCGDIGIDQYDDNGNEIWATILPRGLQHLYHYYYAEQLARGDQRKILFDKKPVEYYQNQFFSTGCYTTHRNFYMVFNDHAKNFYNAISAPGAPLFTYDYSDAMYYKLGRRDSVSKHYLFGEPAKDESKCAFIESADFDDKTNTYATLVECRKEKEYTLCMAWCHLN